MTTDIKFIFQNKQFDTAKPVFIAGYKIKNSWFALNRNDADTTNFFTSNDKLVCKKCYIEKLIFSNNKEDENKLLDFIVTPNDGCFNYSKYASKTYIGRSVAEVINIITKEGV